MEQGSDFTPLRSNSNCNDGGLFLGQFCAEHITHLVVKSPSDPVRHVCRLRREVTGPEAAVGRLNHQSPSQGLSRKWPWLKEEPVCLSSGPLLGTHPPASPLPCFWAPLSAQRGMTLGSQRQPRATTGCSRCHGAASTPRVHEGCFPNTCLCGCRMGLQL